MGYALRGERSPKGNSDGNTNVRFHQKDTLRRFFERIEHKDAELFDGKLIDFEAEIIEFRAMYYITNIFNALNDGNEEKAQKLANLSDAYLGTLNAKLQDVYKISG